MIVEDEGIVALELEHYLQELGYQICAITDKGEEAIVLAGKFKPDLILMDVRLNGPLTGIEAAKIIRQTQDIAIVYLTANADSDTTKEAKISQPYAFLLKPYAERELQTTLEIVLYKHQAELNKKALQAEIERSRRLESLGWLAGGIAHDFNNVLASIEGNLELAIIKTNRGGDSLELIEKALASIDRATILTRRLLTFARGGTPVKMEIKVGHLVKELAAHELQKTDKRLQFNLELPDDLWLVAGDTNQLSLVISNLITNAAQSSTQGGEIMIKARNIELKEADIVGYAPGAYVKLAVVDRGEGIFEENLSKIFDPFFTTKPASSGLGLSIAYSIVKSHGGYIEVLSEMGKGSVFTIYLPAIRVVETSPEIGPKNSEPPLQLALPQTTRLLRALVLEDDSILQISLAELLMSLDWEAELTEKGEDAVQCYKKALEENNPFDVVILDLTIQKGMGGKETIEKLLDIDPQVKAIVSSGYSDDDVIANYQRYGFKEVLPKPYSLKQLKTALSRCVSNR